MDVGIEFEPEFFYRDLPISIRMDGGQVLADQVDHRSLPLEGSARAEQSASSVCHGVSSSAKAALKSSDIRAHQLWSLRTSWLGSDATVTVRRCAS